MIFIMKCMMTIILIVMTTFTKQKLPIFGEFFYMIILTVNNLSVT